MKDDNMPAPLLKKGKSVVKIAKSILGKDVAVPEVEDLAACLMYAPPKELARLRKRLALQSKAKKEARVHSPDLWRLGGTVAVVKGDAW